MANFTPFKLKKLMLNDRDLKMAFTEFVVYEDMFQGSISGYIDVMESEQVRESLPIIGEEILQLEFASTTMTTNVADSYISLVMKVTKMTMLSEAHKSGEGGQANIQYTYRLHFQSLTSELNKLKRIRKQYEGTGTDIASTIMKEMFNIEFQDVDDAKYKTEVVFPNWNPFKCIDYVGKMSISSKHGDPYYIFYEDRDGYHFTTLSELMDKDKSVTIKTLIVTSLNDPEQDEYLVQGMEFLPLFDVLENELHGMYGGTLITYDKISKEFKEQTDTYSNTFDQFKHVGKEKLTKIKPDAPKRRMQTLLVNDQANPGPYAHSDEWAIKHHLRAGQMRGMRSTFWLNRATNIKLGDVIEWNFKNNEGNQDKILSGKWLITKMKHVLTPVMYTCQLEGLKDGLG